MLKEIPKSDIITRPIKVYKEWSLDKTMIKPIFAKSGSFGDYDAEIEEKSHGFSKISLFIWFSLSALDFVSSYNKLVVAIAPALTNELIV